MSMMRNKIFEKWVNGAGAKMYDYGLEKLLVRSENCLERFENYMDG